MLFFQSNCESLCSLAVGASLNLHADRWATATCLSRRLVPPSRELRLLTTTRPRYSDSPSPTHSPAEESLRFAIQSLRGLKICSAP